MQENKEIETKKSMIDNINPQIVIGLGVILTFIGGFLAYRNEIKYRTDAIESRFTIDSLVNKNNLLNKQIDIKADEIKTKSDEIDKTTIKNLGLSEKNKKLNQRIDIKAKQNQELIGTNIKLSEELVRETKEVKAEISGGDSYLKIYLVHDIPTNKLKVLGEIIGEYNVRSINLTIDSRYKVVKSVYNTKIEELNAGVPHELKTLPLPTIEAMLYEIRIVAKNNKYLQYAYVHKLGDQFYSQHVYFNDMSRSYCIGETFKPNNYPQYYKELNPSFFEQLNIKYDLENKETIERAKEMLKWQGFSDKRINDFWGIPFNVIKQLRQEVENEK